jgi:multicomponent Na+:H+ antiporter subunit G
MATEALSVALLTLGAVFVFAGTVGLLRFPDTCSRLHAVAKADNTGLGLIAVGLALRASLPSALKLLLIWGLALIASTVASQLLAKVAVETEARRGEEEGP